jgi:lysophospholipase L1-like esterase
MLAKNYSSSKTYVVGEYAWEAGVLKRCIIPISAGETYTAAHWTDACLGDDLTSLKSAFDNVTEPTRNLWIWGDQFVPANGSTTQKGITDVNIPAGTYTLSALVERTGSANCRMVFYKNSVSSANLLANPYIAANSRNSVTFTLSEAATIIVIYSGPNATANVDSTWKNIQLETGSRATEYIYPICCVDPVARENAEEALDIVIPLNEQVIGAVGTDESFEQKTISAGAGYGSGKYWNSESTTAVIANSANYYAYAPFAVVPGEKYKLEITQGDSSKQYPAVVVDSNYTILSTYRDTTIGEKTFIFTIPENGAYILITTTTAAYSGTKLYKAVYSLSQNLSEISGGMFNWNGKNVAIIGDSISTNGDYNPETNPFGNVPEIVIGADDVGVTLSAYVTLYDVWTDTSMTTPTGLTIGGHTFTDEEIGTEVTFTPVEADIGKMVGKPSTYNPASRFVWWEVAQERMKFNPIAVCWSGSSLSSHEGGKKLYKASYGWHPATIRKCGIRQSGSMSRTAPDVIIVYRGTNDFSHEPYVGLALSGTEINGYPGNYPASDAVNNNGWSYGLVDAMMVLVKKLREAYPKAVIVFATLNVFKRVNYSEYPTNNGVNTLPQYNDTIRKTAESLGCYVIDFANDGITFENCYSGGYITDSATTPTHPSDKGHAVMGKRALLDLAKVNGME